MSKTPEPDGLPALPQNPFMTPMQAAGPVGQSVRRRDPVAESRARQYLAASKIADAIEKALAVAPPLSPEQIKLLTAMLRAGGQR